MNKHIGIMNLYVRAYCYNMGYRNKIELYKMIPNDATHQRQDGSAYYKRGLKNWMIHKDGLWVETKIPNDWSLMPIFKKGL